MTILRARSLEKALFDLGMNIGARETFITSQYRDPDLRTKLFDDFRGATAALKPEQRDNLIAAASKPLQAALVSEHTDEAQRTRLIWSPLTDMSAKYQGMVQHLHKHRLNEDALSIPGKAAAEETPEEVVVRQLTTEAAYLPIAFGNLQQILAQAPLPQRRQSASSLQARNIPLIKRQYADPIINSSGFVVGALGYNFNRLVDEQRQKIEALQIVGSDYFRSLDPRLWPVPCTGRN